MKVDFIKILDKFLEKCKRKYKDKNKYYTNKIMCFQTSMKWQELILNLHEFIDVGI